MKKRVDIEIQSISDIITNSSSEVFCRIYSDKKFSEIFEIMETVFKSRWDEDDEMTPMAHDSEDYSYGAPENAPRHVIVTMPYGFENVETFFKAGIPAILNERIGSSNFSIEWEPKDSI